jgi:hypothetical protein
MFYLKELAAFTLVEFLFYRIMSPERGVEFQIPLLTQLLNTVLDFTAYRQKGNSTALSVARSLARLVR